MTSAIPPVSVVMPARNAAAFLEASVGSILTQSYSDFELIILDDASDDDSWPVLESLAARDARIRLHRSPQRLGIVGAANYVVSHARGGLIARMDADDTCEADRLDRQVALLAEEPEVVLVGTLCDGIDAEGNRIRPRDRSRLTHASSAPPFPHGSAMFRRSVFDQLGGYREACAGWEDQDLFIRMGMKGAIAVLPDALYHYRFHGRSATLTWTGDADRIHAVRTRCFAALHDCGSYEQVLADAVARSAAEPLSPIPLRYEGGMRVWAGQRAMVFQKLVERNASIRTLAWAAWATLHPASLRGLSRLAMTARDRAAGLWMNGRRACRWHFA